jgi:cephalosporin hydroxylase
MEDEMNTNDKNQVDMPAQNTQSLLQGDALKQAARNLWAEVQLKIEGPQNGVRTSADNALLSLIWALEQLDEALPWEESVMLSSASVREQLMPAFRRLQLFLSRTSQGRFVTFQERFQTAPGEIHSSCDICDADMAMSQGVFHCMQWKGIPLFKTVYDFSIYAMMLWTLRPRTIIELGSGTGSSAIWLADLTKMFEISSQIYSVDLKKPELQVENVHFVRGDCQKIDTVFDEDLLRKASHPWILIEDAHVNVYGVLSHFHSYLMPGDYVVIEDSTSKQDDIKKFLLEKPGCYKVDTLYTDFFGRNATCAHDSIFVRV